MSARSSDWLRGLALVAISILAGGALQPALAASPQVATPVLPDLNPWLQKNGEPGEAAWQHAAHFSIAYEIDPGHDTPAPVSTQVDAGYTTDALWLRFQAQDPHPADIGLHYRVHDGVMSYFDDYVGIFLSPFNDAQWAYEMFCSAGGAEYDAFRQQNNEYSSWDAVWSCTASRTATGYEVVMKVPFASIKFPHSPDPQKWGLIFFRNWPRNLRHQLFSRPLDYDSNCTLCSMQPMRTAAAVKTTPADIQLIPSVTVIRTDSKKDSTEGLEQGSPGLKGSLDARWVLRPDLEWSATLNPNFSEVAPDVLQLSANRQFALFYQENRPFFEQGTQVFNTPSLRFSSDLFNPSGSLIDTLAISDPRFATKLVGQVGANEIGALITQDTQTSILLPGPQSSTVQSFDFTTRDELLRYRYDVGASAVGFYASDRDGGGYHNGLYATDATWQIDPSDVLTALVGSSSTTYPGAVASALGTSPGGIKGLLWTVDYSRTRHNYNFDLNLSHVADGFRADLGYLPQVGYDQGAFLGEYDFYAPDEQWWQNFGFGTISNWTRAAAGGQNLDRKVKLYTVLHANYQSKITLYATRDQQYYLGRNFTLDQYELDAIAQPTEWLNGEVDVTGGDGVDYTGVRKAGLLSVNTTLYFQPGKHLKIDLVYDYEQLDLAGKRLFTANVYDVRFAWYFTSHLFAQAIGQGQAVRNNTASYPPDTPHRTGSFATQWLLGYQVNPWTVFYAGSSEGYQETTDGQLLPQQRTFFLKGSYYFQPF
ncbi:MAG TPA: DUF5916 domain-containing protein [Steroidobacteraceae bacterium]|nr:DUF5916 domain-containing protein [Steroidobacteraceae bacterium]